MADLTVTNSEPLQDLQVSKSEPLPQTGFLSHLGNTLSNAPAGIAQTIAHPLDALKNWRDQSEKLHDAAVDSFEKGDYVDAAAHGVNYLANIIPGLGKVMDDAAVAGTHSWDEFTSKLGDVVGTALLAKVGEKLPGAPKAIADAAKTVADTPVGRAVVAGAQELPTLKAMKTAKDVYKAGTAAAEAYRATSATPTRPVGPAAFDRGYAAPAENPTEVNPSTPVPPAAELPTPPPPAATPAQTFYATRTPAAVASTEVNPATPVPPATEPPAAAPPIPTPAQQFYATRTPPAVTSTEVSPSTPIPPRAELPPAAGPPAAGPNAAALTALRDQIAQGYGYRDFARVKDPNAASTIDQLAQQVYGEPAKPAPAAPAVAAPPAAPAPQVTTIPAKSNGAAAADAAIAANRAPRVQKFADYLDKNEVPLADLERVPTDSPFWDTLATQVGIKTPSEATVTDLIKELRSRAAARAPKPAPPAPGAQMLTPSEEYLQILRSHPGAIGPAQGLADLMRQ